MDNFVKICRVEDLPENRGVRFEVEDEDLAIFKINGEVFVISNICPHNHVSLIYKGTINKYSVACPVHGWEFDLNTGNTLNNQSKIRTYETKVIDGELFVKLSSRFLNW